MPAPPLVPGPMAVMVVPAVTPVPEMTCPTAIVPDETDETVRVVPVLPAVPLSILPVNDADIAVVVTRLVPGPTLWDGLTCQARPAPETMVVPGAMPQDWLDGGHAMTCPIASAPDETAPTVSDVPSIPPVNVASE